MARLATLLPDFPHALWQLPPVTRVAMSWLCEMATAQRALPPGEPSYRWVDFEAMLADPAAAIPAQATHFGLPVDSARIDDTLARPVIRTFSKEPQQAHSPHLPRHFHTHEHTRQPPP